MTDLILSLVAGTHCYGVVVGRDETGEHWLSRISERTPGGVADWVARERVTYASREDALKSAMEDILDTLATICD